MWLGKVIQSQATCLGKSKEHLLLDAICFPNYISSMQPLVGLLKKIRDQTVLLVGRSGIVPGTKLEICNQL